MATVKPSAVLLTLTTSLFFGVERSYETENRSGREAYSGKFVTSPGMVVDFTKHYKKVVFLSHEFVPVAIQDKSDKF